MQKVRSFLRADERVAYRARKIGDVHEIVTFLVKNPVLPHGALEDECRSIRFLVLISMGPEGGSRRGIAEYLR